VTPVLIKNNRAYVQATIGYGVLETELLLVIDTGASVTTLFRPAVERIFMRGLNRTTGRTTSGDVLSVELATVDFIEVGPYRKERLQAGIVDVGGQSVDYDGLLGMNFLRGLDFNIDFDRGVIVWR
jgi:predicted aspartyl protease